MLGRLDCDGLHLIAQDFDWKWKGIDENREYQLEDWSRSTMVDWIAVNC